MLTPSQLARRSESASRTFAGSLTFASSTTVALSSDDCAAGEWLSEYLKPWFTPASRAEDWRVHLSSSASAPDVFAAQRPADASLSACFALDTRVLHLPAWRDAGRLRVVDSERSCCFDVAPRSVEVFGSPETLRWRFTAVLIMLEIIAARMRHRSLDLHSAAVEIEGRGVLLIGPKGAGKTTLSIYLLRSGGCRPVANDRVFVTEGSAAATAHGVPTPVKIRAPTLRKFPDVLHDFPAVDRPYLYRPDELPGATPATGPRSEHGLALSPPQFHHQMGVRPCASTPLAVLIFPRVGDHAAGWSITPLDPGEIRAELQSNRYGSAVRDRGPTVFEDADQGRAPDPSTLIDHLAGTCRGYRLILGRGAYATNALARRIEELAGRGAP